MQTATSLLFTPPPLLTVYPWSVGVLGAVEFSDEIITKVFNSDKEFQLLHVVLVFDLQNYLRFQDVK